MSFHGSSSFGSTFEGLAARFKQHDTQTHSRLRDAQQAQEPGQFQRIPIVHQQSTHVGTTNKQETSKKPMTTYLAVVHLHRQLPPLQYPQPRRSPAVEGHCSSQTCPCCHLRRASSRYDDPVTYRSPYDLCCSNSCPDMSVPDVFPGVSPQTQRHGPSNLAFAHGYQQEFRPIFGHLDSLRAESSPNSCTTEDYGNTVRHASRATTHKS